MKIDERFWVSILQAGLIAVLCGLGKWVWNTHSAVLKLQMDHEYYHGKRYYSEASQ